MQILLHLLLLSDPNPHIFFPERPLSGNVLLASSLK